MESSTRPVRIKIISMGNAGVGKSTLIKRFCEGKFVRSYLETVGVDYGVKKIDLDGNVVRINFWDFSGHEAFAEVRNELYKGTHGAILVFDVNTKDTFDALDGWLREARTFGALRTVYVLVGNKIDLSSSSSRKGKSSRQVSRKQAKRWASAHDMEYFEVSSATGANVEDAFLSLFRRALKGSADRSTARSKTKRNRERKRVQADGK